MAAIWPDTVVEENNLSQNIYTLRRVLGEGRGEHRYVVTVPGRGYRFVAHVTTPAREDRLEEAEISQPAVGRSAEGGARPTEITGKRRKGGWLAAGAVVAVAGLSLLGLYIWRLQKSPTRGAP